MCRRLRSILPSVSTSLKAEVPNLLIVHSEMELSHKRKKKYYDSEAKTLPPLEVNNLVRIQQPNKLWKLAMVTQKHNDRSYTIQTQDGTIYRRNRRHLLKSNETNFWQYYSNESFPTISTNPLSDDMYVSKPPDIGAETSQDTKKILSPTKANQPYITRSGRVVKPKIIVRVDMVFYSEFICEHLFCSLY